MMALSCWVCPAHEPKVIGQLRIAIGMLRSEATNPDTPAAAAHLVATAMKLPSRYSLPLQAAVSGQDVAEHDLELAARALELALGHEPAILVELREARHTVMSFARGPLSQSGGGNVDCYLEARRRHAALLSRFDRLPQRAKRSIDDYVAGKTTDVERLLDALDLLEGEEIRKAA